MQLLGELKGKRPDVINLKIDSQSAIQLSKDSIFHDRSKHTDIRYHYIHECIEENRVTVESIGTADQLADILTKALGRERLCELRSKLGVIDV